MMKTSLISNMISEAARIKAIGTYLNKIAPIDPMTISDFVRNAHLRSIKKREPFLREGERCEELLFTHQGSLRYFLLSKAQDLSKDFCLDTTNPFCTGFTSFFTGMPSLINIEALEDSLVSVWPRSYILPLFETMPWLLFARRIAEALYIRKEQREISLLSDSAEERYMKFVKEFRDVTQRVPQFHIASYLGITPESLSRIRRKLGRSS